jgi:class 3 adenylate cyclase
MFRTYQCQAALLFVDMSVYSLLTAAVAHKGADMISAVVNAYLDRLFEIPYDHGGDVINFAGDAIIAVWEGPEKDLEVNVLCAARCAVDLQQKAREHPVKVEGTTHNCQIHCGLAVVPWVRKSSKRKPRQTCSASIIPWE